MGKVPQDIALYQELLDIHNQKKFSSFLIISKRELKDDINEVL